MWCLSYPPSARRDRPISLARSRRAPRAQSNASDHLRQCRHGRAVVCLPSNRNRARRVRFSACADKFGPRPVNRHCCCKMARPVRHDAGRAFALRRRVRVSCADTTLSAQPEAETERQENSSVTAGVNRTKVPPSCPGASLPAIRDHGPLDRGRTKQWPVPEIM